MGIIAEFFELKEEIDKFCKNYSRIKVVRDIQLYNKKKKLIKVIDKLRRCNTPIDKEQMLELAQSLHGYTLGSNIYNDSVEIMYYPNAKIYKLRLLPNCINNDTIINFEVYIDSENKKPMNIEITKKELAKGKDANNNYKISSNTISTNLKEIHDEIYYCNCKLYDVLANYIYECIIGTSD